jgi:hypothetical protein
MIVRDMMLSDEGCHAALLTLVHHYRTPKIKLICSSQQFRWIFSDLVTVKSEVYDRRSITDGCSFENVHSQLSIFTIDIHLPCAQSSAMSRRRDERRGEERRG